MSGFTGTKEGLRAHRGRALHGQARGGLGRAGDQDDGRAAHAQAHASSDRAAHAEPRKAAQDRAGGVCCQCSQCTQMCPRNALGLHVEPHKAMRAITTGNGALLGNARSGAGLLQLRRVHQLRLPHGPFALGGHGAAQGRAGARGHPAGAGDGHPRGPVHRAKARAGEAPDCAHGPERLRCPGPVHGRGTAAQTGAAAASPARGQARRGHGEARATGCAAATWWAKFPTRRWARGYTPPSTAW